MESENFFSKVPEAEKSVDLNEEIRKIYELITKMDVGRASVETIPIKAYIEKIIDKKGELNPLRVEHLKKEVSRIYYGEFLKNKELKKETHESKNPSEMKFFKIGFEGQGFRGMNYIEFYRENETLWKTSDIGRGHTTTCSKDPDWLVFEDPEKWEAVSSENLSEKVYTRKKKGIISIFGMNAVLYYTDFKHMGGGGHIYEFEFSSKEDADKFADFLFQNEKTNFTPDEKLKYMRDSRDFFMWNQMSCIDKKYERLLGYEIEEEFWEKYPDPYEYTEVKRQFREAVSEYEKTIAKKLLDLTESVAKVAELEANEKFKLETPLESHCAKYDYVMEARYSAINWTMVKKLLHNHEGEIMAILDKIKKQDKEKRKKEVTPLAEGAINAIASFISTARTGYDPRSYEKLDEQILKSLLIKDHILYEELSKIIVTVRNIDSKLGPGEEILERLARQSKNLNELFKKRYAD